MMKRLRYSGIELISNTSRKFPQWVSRIVGGLLLCLVFFSCEKQETIFNGPYYVRFTNEVQTAKESESTLIKIGVHNTGPQLSEPITVTYSISGAAREGIDYQIEGTRGTLVIPANQSFGYINLHLLNNANNILESQNIIFTLSSVTPDKLAVGTSKEGILGKTHTFTILDDCILGGTYIGTAKGANAAPVSDISITSSNCLTYNLSNWNVGLLSYPSITLNLSFKDNLDNTLEIPKQDQAKLAKNIGVEKFLIEGNGSVNPITRVITMNITLLTVKDSPTIQITFIPD